MEEQATFSLPGLKLKEDKMKVDIYVTTHGQTFLRSFEIGARLNDLNSVIDGFIANCTNKILWKKVDNYVGCPPTD